MAGLAGSDVRRRTAANRDRTIGRRANRDRTGTRPLDEASGHWTRPPAIGRKRHPLATISRRWAASICSVWAARSRAATARSAWIPWKRPTPPSRPPKTSTPMNQNFRSADCRRSADIDHCECGARPHPIFAAPGLYAVTGRTWGNISLLCGRHTADSGSNHPHARDDDDDGGGGGGGGGGDDDDDDDRPTDRPTDPPK